MNIAGAYLVLAGGCRHTIYLILDKGLGGLETIARFWYIAQPFAIMAIAVGRISVAVLILRIMGPSKWRKIFLYFSIISTFVISSATCILMFLACNPPKALWNPLIKAKCWDVNVINYIGIATSAWNALMDVCLALLPVWMFWNLKLNKKKRVTISILMSMGIFAETFLTIVCGCIPTLKPIYDRFSNRPGRSPTLPPTYPPYMKPYQSASSRPSKPRSDKYSLSFADSTQPCNDDEDIGIAITHQYSVRSQSDGGSATETVQSDPVNGVVVNVSKMTPEVQAYKKPGFASYPLDTFDIV
ncbi:MAG: hypothetical protein Q9187_008806 [Circinaria calcarea]